MAKSSSNISVVIITKNEDANIEECIVSCKKVTDNIVVVDSYSTDETVQKAKNLGANVIESEWQGYGFAKNTGAENCNNDWILSIDADERIDEEMVKTIRDVNLEKDHIYGFRRLNHIGQVPITHGEWNPDTRKYKASHG